MDEELADQAAEQYGRISELRAEVASAMTAGDYARASDMAEHAVELSTDMLRGLVNVPGIEGLPYRLLAFAVRDDLALLRASLGDFAGIAQALTDLDEIWDAARQNVIQLLASVTYGSEETKAFGLRACPHGRPSYDGHCLARPPCPQK
jgi:hypothetical protein